MVLWSAESCIGNDTPIFCSCISVIPIHWNSEFLLSHWNCKDIVRSYRLWSLNICYTGLHICIIGTMHSRLYSHKVPFYISSIYLVLSSIISPSSDHWMWYSALRTQPFVSNTGMNQMASISVGVNIRNLYLLINSLWWTCKTDSKAVKGHGKWWRT